MPRPQESNDKLGPKARPDGRIYHGVILLLYWRVWLTKQGLNLALRTPQGMREASFCHYKAYSLAPRGGGHTSVNCTTHNFTGILTEGILAFVAALAGTLMSVLRPFALQ